jgi:hypothetical protein
LCRRLEREHCDIGFDFVCWACSVASGYRGRFACHVSLSSFFAVAVLCCVLSCVYFFLAFPCFIDRALYFRSRFFQLCLSGIALLALLPCLVLLASSSLSDPLFLYLSLYVPFVELSLSLCLSPCPLELWTATVHGSGATVVALLAWLSFLHLFSVTFAYCAHSYAYFLLALICCIGWVLFVDGV